MQIKRAVIVAVGLSLSAGLGAARAQDWVKAAPAHKTVLVDNEHIRLVDVVVPPGAVEPLHSHPEYIEMVLQGARMKVTYAGKAPEIWDAEKKAYWGQPDPPHSMENVDKHALHLLLIELKDRPFTPSPETESDLGGGGGLDAFDVLCAHPVAYDAAAQMASALRVASAGLQERPSCQSSSGSGARSSTL